MQHPQHHQHLPQHQQLQQLQQHQHMQQQQHHHPPGVCAWQTGVVAGLPQQLRPSFQQQQQHLLQEDAAARSSGTGTGTGCAAFPTPPAAGASGAAAAAAAAAAAVGSPVDSIGSIDIMGLAAVDDDELDDIVDLLGSESGEEFELESNCCQQRAGAGAGAGGHADSAGDASVQAGQVTVVAAAQAALAVPPAVLAGPGFEAADIKVKAQSMREPASPAPLPAAADHSAHLAATAVAAAAAAAAAQAAQLKSELHSMQLSETFSFDVPSSGGGAAGEAVLEMAVDDGFDFPISSDDFDMLTAGW